MTDHLLVLDGLIRSATAPSTRHDDLRGFLELHLEAAAGQAESARARSVERSDRIRGRIRAAWGSLPLDGEIDKAKIGACCVRMKARGWRADGRTIADELRLMQTEIGMYPAGPYATTKST